MTDFQNEINERLSMLTQTNALTKKKAQFDKLYSMALVDADWNEIRKVDDLQASFLDLLNERYPEIVKNIRAPLENRFNEMYQNSEDETERQYKPQDELVMHKIQVPSANSDEWQMMYETKSDDTIFHIEFNGWTFKLIGVTH